MSQTTTPSGADVDIAALCDKQVTDWQAAGKMEPYAWDFRGFAADAIARYRAQTDPAVAALIADNDLLRRVQASTATEAVALIARNAELEAEREALRAAAEKAHAFLTHNYWGNWTYMEGSEVYEELREHAKLLSDALARTPAKENGSCDSAT